MPAEPTHLEGDLIRAVELLADTFAALSIRYAVVGGDGPARRAGSVSDRSKRFIGKRVLQWQ
jgi:hypothetical protein